MLIAQLFGVLITMHILELWRDDLSFQDLKKSAVLVFANKQDVRGCLTPAEISQQLNLASLKTHRYQIQACCALTGDGLVYFMQFT